MTKFVCSLLLLLNAPSNVLSQFGVPQPVAPYPGIPLPPQPPQPIQPVAPLPVIPSIGGLPSFGSGSSIGGRAQVIGPYGQDCTPALGDFPDACPTVGTTISRPIGKIECVHNFDCCTCGSLICGQKDPSSSKCIGLVCGGDSSCYGVKDAKVYGDSQAGVDIVCNGDKSCMSTKITGENVGELYCGGDGSCAYSDMNIACLPHRPCVLNCMGDNSCEADPNDMINRYARFIVTNTKGMYCSSHACRFGTYMLHENDRGDVVCNAERACEGAQLTITGVESIQCGGIRSCEGATMLIINPKNHFRIDCNAYRACKGLSIEIIITDPTVEIFRGIACGGIESCEGLMASISKIVPIGTNTPPGSTGLTINEFGCNARRACFGAVFDVTPNVIFQTCGCAGGASQSCEGLVGVDSCMHGLDKIECVGIGCKNMIETITNPAQYFQLICSDIGSCENFALQININSQLSAPSILGGVTCGAIGACKGLRLFILNTGTGRVDAGTVTCGAGQSCDGAAFVLQGADFSAPINCGTTTSCTSCQKFVDNRYSPCA